MIFMYPVQNTVDKGSLYDTKVEFNKNKGNEKDSWTYYGDQKITGKEKRSEKNVSRLV